MKRISCGDLVPGCAYTVQAGSDAEVLSRELSHLKEAHGIAVTPQFIERARERIEDVDSGRPKRSAAQ